MMKKFQANKLIDSKVFFITIFLILHTLFMLGQGRCSAMAPDEITYLAIFRDIFLGIPNSGLSEVYGSSKLIYYFYYFPGYLFNLIFQNDIYAIRFSAIFFSLILFLTTEKIISSAHPANDKWIKRVLRLSLLFIPSIFVFTSSGVRESLLIFSLILTFYGLGLVLQENLKIGFLIFTIGLIFSTSSKIYLFPILAVSSIIVFFLTKKHQFRNLIFVSASAIITLVLFWQPISHVVLNVEYQRPSNSSISSQINPKNFVERSPIANGVLVRELPSATSLWLNYCFEQNTLGFLKRPIQQIFMGGVLYSDLDLNPSETKNSSVASDKIQEVDGQPQIVSNKGEVVGGASPVAILYKYYEFRRVLPFEQIPLNILKFVTNPILDLKSKFLLIFLIEVPFWVLSVLVLCFSILGVARLRFNWSWMTVYSGLIFLLFLVYSGATEVNVGTSIRHRTFLWIPLIFLLSGIRRDSYFLSGAGDTSGKEKQ